MTTKKKKVKDLREGDIVVIHNVQRIIIRSASPCKAKGYYRAETADPNYPINTHGDNIVDIVVFDSP